MKVRDIMETNFVTIHEDATYKHVADILYTTNRGCVFVLDGLDQLVGLVSEHDLFRVLFPFYSSYYLNPELYTDPREREGKIAEVQDHPVKHFMRQALHTAAPDEPIMRAGATMLAKDARRLPVVSEGKLVGVVMRRAIYRALYEKHLRGTL